jgi:hypothetical protein
MVACNRLSVEQQTNAIVMLCVDNFIYIIPL